MPVWLINWLKHNLARFLGVLCVGIVIVGVPMVIYFWGFHNGYKKAVKDRPTYGTVGTVINNANPDYKIIGVRANLWQLKLGLGW